MAWRVRHASNRRAEWFSQKPKRVASCLACRGPLSMPDSQTGLLRSSVWLMQYRRPFMAKVLIVDDSALSRRILRRILEDAGHDVFEAEDGMVALEKYFLEKPDLVLLDLIMKGMVGVEVLQKIRQMDDSARIVVASADIQNSTKVITEKAGAMGFLTKPFNEAQVISAVDSVLKER